MGGYGRGRGHEPKRQVEQSVILALSWMLVNNYLDLSVGQRGIHKITWRNYYGEPRFILTADIERLSSYEMRLYLFDTGQIVYLESTPLPFGGLRWWFRCPGCKRRCTKLYLPRGASAFLCRECHDLTYATCIEGKSTTAFLAEIGLRQGLSLAQVKSAIGEDGRARNKWRRKRDRRAGYKGRLQEMPEKSLKRTMQEAKAASDIAKSLGRVGML